MTDTVSTNPMASAAQEALEPSPGSLLRKRIFGHAGFMIGAIVLGIIVFMAIFAPFISPGDPYDQVLSRKLIPPIWHDSPKATWEHPLGTDQLGRDYMTRLFYGARISLLIGFAAMLISGIIGTTLGVIAGYFGGRVDMVVNFIITTRLSMPVVLVALAVVSLVGSSLNVVIWVLGLLIWDRFAVVMRSATQQVRNLDFVTAAQALGCSTPRILFVHLVPNVLSVVIVYLTLTIPAVMLFEAFLSFLGLGVEPPKVSWGLLAVDGTEAINAVRTFWWLVAWPAAAMGSTLLALNVLGDGLRDALDPKLRGR